MRLTDEQQAVLMALDELNLIGELQDDSHRLDPVVVKQFFARKSVKRICSYASSLLAQGHDRKQVALLVCQEYGPFLEDACLAATRPAVSDDEDLTAYERLIARSAKKSTTQRAPAVLENETLRLFRVPIEWLNVSQQRDVELYLEYLQSLIRESVQEYINDLADAIGNPRRRTINSLLNLLKKSPCIKYYRRLGRLFLTQSEYRRHLQKHGQQAEVIMRNSKDEVRYLADPDLEILIGDYLSGPHVGAGYEGFLGFILGDVNRDNLFESEAEVFAMRHTACTSCEACIVTFALSRLIYDLCAELLFWNPAEVADLVLRNVPLPKFIGYIDVDNPSWSTISAEVDGFVQTDTGKPRYSTTIRYASASFPCVGYALLRFLPCIPPEAIAEVSKRVLPNLPHEQRQRIRPIGAKYYAMYQHAWSTVRLVTVTDTTYPERIVGTLPLSWETVSELVQSWNQHAPADWRFGGQNPAKSFFKALKNAYNAIQHQNLSINKNAPKDKLGYIHALNAADSKFQDESK